jgi:hypothetical protein
MGLRREGRDQQRVGPGPSALREMTRLGLKPGVAITVETGARNASLRVRIGDRTDSLRLSQHLASGISVIGLQARIDLFPPGVRR